MKSFFSIQIYSFLFLILIICSCEGDDIIQKADLLGQWEIETGFRNGKQTESFTGMYFNFEEEGVLLTNMTGQEETYKYEIDGQSIFQRNGALDADYNVDLLTTDSLILVTTLRTKELKMILSKKK